eukprot:525596-Alexandrium_andersonii.AAC.1
MVDCGSRRIGALTSIGLIADCTLGASHCEDACPSFVAHPPPWIQGPGKGAIPRSRRAWPASSLK